MKKVKEFRVSLMEKDENFSISEEGKGNYIIRASGTFNTEEFFKDKEELSEEEYRNFMEGAIVAVYNQIPKEILYETIGLWITYEDDQKIENAMDLSVLETMGEMGDNIDPIIEFAKMTLNTVEYEDEDS